MSKSILCTENFKDYSRNLILSIKTYINGIGKIEEVYRDLSKTNQMKQFLDFDEIILSQSECIYHTFCDHISNTISDIIAILASGFMNDEASY